MGTLGRALLILALAVSLYGIAASLYGARARRRDWADSGRRAVYAMAALITGAFAILEGAFLTSNFSFATVASHSSTTTPTFYKAAAAWSSQEGSLLLWVWLLMLWSSLVLYLTRHRMRDVTPYAGAVLLAFGTFFCALLVFSASPFTQNVIAPAEGAGLNPLLRHPSMMIHPPMLYSGYTLFAVPFAFAVGALIVRRVDAEWIRATRRFALAAWFFLGVGILLGARWSYAELGWGGYWAWDPVENASLMPWLTGTAFLHSLMIQEKRGMLKVWNVSLVLATGTLAILGTFLVRSGILDSIHAFGASTLGVPFVVLIGALIIGSIVLVVTRRKELASEHRLDSMFSREAIFLANNVVLVGLCFVVFWGTFFPLIAEAVTGEKAAVGPPWFDRYTVPLTIALVFLSGLGPVIAWRRATRINLRRNLLIPTAIAVAVAVVLAALGTADKPMALGMFFVGAFVFASVGQEFWRGTRARMAMSDDGPPAAFVSLVARNRRRYGGYTIHVGMALLFMGVAASSAFEHVNIVRLAPGQSTTVGDTTVRYARPTAVVHERNGGLERLALGADLEVWRDGRKVDTLHTERGYYPSRDVAGLGPIGRFFEGEAVSEVALRAGWRRDLWAAVQPDGGELAKVVDALDARLADATAEQQFAAAGRLMDYYRQAKQPQPFRVMSSPMVTWIWVGGLVVFLGALICLWPAPDAARRRVTARAAARVAQDLGRA